MQVRATHDVVAWQGQEPLRGCPPRTNRSQLERASWWAFFLHNLTWRRSRNLGECAMPHPAEVNLVADGEQQPPKLLTKKRSPCARPRDFSDVVEVGAKRHFSAGADYQQPESCLARICSQRVDPRSSTTQLQTGQMKK